VAADPGVRQTVEAAVNEVLQTWKGPAGTPLDGVVDGVAAASRNEGRGACGLELAELHVFHEGAGLAVEVWLVAKAAGRGAGEGGLAAQAALVSERVRKVVAKEFDDVERCVVQLKAS